jgi:sugar transferase (PEP-CTERM/EpsH1 system associated)
MEHGVVKVVNGLDPAVVRGSICSTTPADDHMRNLVDPRVPVFELRRREGNDPRLVWALYRLLRRERPDIVHTHAWGTLLEGIVAARLARVPAVVHGEHGTLQLQSRQLKAQRWAWLHADRILSVSSRLAERMSQEIGVPLERIHVIRNGVNLERFQGAPTLSARSTFGLPADIDLVIGAVGRLVDVKNHAGLVDAVVELRARGRRVAVVIAGDGPLRPQLEAQIAQHGLEDHVRLLGHRADVEAVLGGLDVFVQSSSSEGMSNTILEAMAAGLPVVATHVGGADEMVVDGETGVLVPARDAVALANALDRLAEAATRRAMGRAGRARALAQFSLDRMIESYQSFYCEMAGRNAAHRPRGLGTPSA